MTQTTRWQEAQEWEANWWSSCGNTFSEEQKQLVYAEKMGLHAEWDYGHFPVYDLKGASVLDIGGGPVSMLLKCKNFSGTVVDPCDYPEWVTLRYDEARIDFVRGKGEDYLIPFNFDEVWIYNVLQHTENPRKVIENARVMCKIIRLFEWVETEKNHRRSRMFLTLSVAALLMKGFWTGLTIVPEGKTLLDVRVWNSLVLLHFYFLIKAGIAYSLEISKGKNV